MRSRLATAHGRARLVRESPQLVAIEAESELAAYHAQGYTVGALRAWQLDLTRRVAAGELSALFGAGSLATDRFQRDLGLRALARRELARDAGSAQAAHVQAYVDGINQAFTETRLPAVEFLLVRDRPRAFTAEDVYLIVQLKYFINSAWQFELLHTLVAGTLDARRAAQLFATFTAEGTTIDPLPRGWDGELAADVVQTLAAGLRGLAILGLDSPDIGSNAFAIAGTRTASGYPLLAADPHMGNVNPGYNILFKLVCDDGLAVVGSHFPGTPGIIVGRNRDCGWGMVGLMADNQDLLLGRVVDGSHVEVAGERVVLDRDATTIAVRGGPDVPHVARGFGHGRMLHARGDRGLFLRWPALDCAIGGFSLSELSRAHDWPSFRRGLAVMTNAPMLAVYADRHGHRGMQAVGLIPRRTRPLGSLVLSLDDPAHAWTGYHEFDSLPSTFDPPGDWVAYANQYAVALFGDRPHLSNRWHPPTRAWRIGELLDGRARHDVATMCAIQDDRVDRFARDHVDYLVAMLPSSSRLAGWDGDTRDTERALVFERWLVALTDALLRGALSPALASRYADLWPAHRWNVLAILRDHAAEWGIADVPAFVARAYVRATRPEPHPDVELRHSLRRHPIGRALFAAHYPYDGGTRETIHVARRNTDFLTASQVVERAPPAFHFGPAFKLVFDFSPGGATHYLANTPASGTFGVTIAATLRRWRSGERYTTRLP